MRQTMSDLIVRDKAMDVLDDFQSNVENCVGNAYAIARQQMIDIPSARHKGKWIKNIDGNYECSECHVAIRGEDKPIYPFCAWCGADMRGE